MMLEKQLEFDFMKEERKAQNRKEAREAVPFLIFFFGYVSSVLAGGMYVAAHPNIIEDTLTKGYEVIRNLF